MTKRDFARLGKQVLPSLPEGMVASSDLIIACPLNEVVRGIRFDGSDFDRTSFYVIAFWIPLYVPTDCIHANFGCRVLDRGADRWDSTEPEVLGSLTFAIRRQAVPLIERVATVEDQIKAARAHAVRFKDPYAYEAAAYGLARLGKAGAAVAALDKLLARLDPKAVAWHGPIATRAAALRETLRRDPEEAARMLTTWREENIRNLGLDRLCPE